MEKPIINEHTMNTHKTKRSHIAAAVVAAAAVFSLPVMADILVGFNDLKIRSLRGPVKTCKYYSMDSPNQVYDYDDADSVVVEESIVTVDDYIYQDSVVVEDYAAASDDYIYQDSVAEIIEPVRTLIGIDEFDRHGYQTRSWSAYGETKTVYSSPGMIEKTYYYSPDTLDSDVMVLSGVVSYRPAEGNNRYDSSVYTDGRGNVESTLRYIYRPCDDGGSECLEIEDNGRGRVDTVVHKYNKLGKIQRVNHKRKGSIIDFDNDRVVCKSNYSSDGTVTRRHEFEYDDNIVRTYTTYQDTPRYLSCERTLDGHDNPILEIYYHPDGTIDYINNIEYVYDSHGNWIEQITDREDIIYSVRESRDIEYHTR